MQADIATVRQRVLQAAKESRVAAQVEDVVVETDRDDEGTDFLRVLVQVKDSEKASEADLEALLEAIENAVGIVDQRYPSVRFLDAA